MKIGYAPYGRDLTPPGDRRRFPYYAAKRGLEFEIADPDEAYDVVVVTPRADLRRWAAYRPGSSKLVFDIVDSYLDIPRTNVKMMLRGPAKFAAGESSTPFFSWRRAVEQILERADAAVCATPEQGQVIARLCANVHPILDFQTALVTAVKDNYAAGEPFNLVWEGLAENARWFSEIQRPLEDVARRRPLRLHLVTPLRFKQVSQRFWTRETASIVRRHFDDIEVHPWSEDAVARVAITCDLAVIPLPLDRPLEAGKPESKLIAFWRMGLPVITSATPAYRRVMDSAGQDLYCTSEADWRETLEGLADDAAAREQAGTSGHAYATAEYGDERLVAKWDAVLESL